MTARLPLAMLPLAMLPLAMLPLAMLPLAMLPLAISSLRGPWGLCRELLQPEHALLELGHLLLNFCELTLQRGTLGATLSSLLRKGAWSKEGQGQYRHDPFRRLHESLDLSLGVQACALTRGFSAGRFELRFGEQEVECGKAQGNEYWVGGFTT